MIYFRVSEHYVFITGMITLLLFSSSSLSISISSSPLEHEIDTDRLEDLLYDIVKSLFDIVDNIVKSII